MVKKNMQRNEVTKKANLSMPRLEVQKKLLERIELGKKIMQTGIRNEAELTAARAERTKWNSYNEEYLARCFDAPEISESYAIVGSYGGVILDASLAYEVQNFRERVANKITTLESVVEKLELIPELRPAQIPSPRRHVSSKEGDSVFIVHGHDDGAKSSVVRFIEKLGLRAVVLHEKPNKGQTIIEKFESNAADVGFAIVLLTPDDEGRPKRDESVVKDRARQNVILELGYFIGKLGRARVCALQKSEIEPPSDILGVVYTAMDAEDGWQFKLAKELKAAGFDVDMNHLL